MFRIKRLFQHIILLILVVLGTDSLLFSQEINVPGYESFQDETGNFGIKTSGGKIILSCQYHQFVQKSFGVVAVKKNQQFGSEHSYSYGYFDFFFQEILPCNYAGIEEFSDKLLLITSNESLKMGMIDKSKNIKIPLEYDLLEPTENNWFCAAKNGMFGMIDIENNVKIPFNFIDLKPFTNGLAPARKKELMGFIDLQGKMKIEPKFTNCYEFSFNFAHVSINDLHSIVDTNSNLLFPFVFVDIQIIDTHLFIFQAPASFRGAFGERIVETNKNFKFSQFAPTYEDLEDQLDNQSTIKGVLPFAGVTTKTGKIIGGEDFTRVILLQEGENNKLFGVQSIQQIDEFDNWSWALMNTSGELISDFDFIEFEYVEASKKWVGKKEVKGELIFVDL